MNKIGKKEKLRIIVAFAVLIVVFTFQITHI